MHVGETKSTPIVMTPTMVQGLLTVSSAAFTAFRAIQYGVISSASTAFGAMLLPCLICAAGNTVGSVISLGAGLLVDKTLITPQAGMALTVIAAIASLIVTIVALSLLGAPMALAAASIILTIATGTINCFVASRRMVPKEPKNKIVNLLD